LKWPCCFEVNEGESFAFAGIWDRWKNARRNVVEAGSILTTTPNAVTAAVHDRMPVILHLDSYDVARSGTEDCGFRFGTIETLQCSGDAVLSRKRSDQPRRE
jgi:hypothetical protein